MLRRHQEVSFSAQPRADGDEACWRFVVSPVIVDVSVLNREPMGMKRPARHPSHPAQPVSVLNREPMGMKLESATVKLIMFFRFSAQPRADGDEAS